MRSSSSLCSSVFARVRMKRGSYSTDSAVSCNKQSGRWGFSFTDCSTACMYEYATCMEALEEFSSGFAFTYAVRMFFLFHVWRLRSEYAQTLSVLFSFVRLFPDHGSSLRDGVLSLEIQSYRCQAFRVSQKLRHSMVRKVRTVSALTDESESC